MYESRRFFPAFFSMPSLYTRATPHIDLPTDKTVVYHVPRTYLLTADGWSATGYPVTVDAITIDVELTETPVKLMPIRPGPRRFMLSAPKTADSNGGRWTRAVQLLAVHPRNPTVPANSSGIFLNPAILQQRLPSLIKSVPRISTRHLVSAPCHIG